MEEFDALIAIIKCPLNVRKKADLELKRLLIRSIFNNTLSYTKDEWLRTKEIPVVYAIKPDILEKIR